MSRCKTCWKFHDRFFCDDDYPNNMTNENTAAIDEMRGRARKFKGSLYVDYSDIADMMATFAAAEIARREGEIADALQAFVNDAFFGKETAPTRAGIFFDRVRLYIPSLRKPEAEG